MRRLRCVLREFFSLLTDVVLWGGLAAALAMAAVLWIVW